MQVGLLLACEDLLELASPDALLKRTVELALDPVGLASALVPTRAAPAAHVG
jgi:hypothetical protein